MSVKTFLEKAGEDILKVITFGEVAAQDAAPFISLADPALGALISATVSAIGAAQAAGAAAAASAPTSSTDTQKAALVLAAIEPQALTFAKSQGLSTPTAAQLETYVNGIVAALNAFTVPSTTPTPAAPAVVEIPAVIADPTVVGA